VNDEHRNGSPGSGKGGARAGGSVNQDEGPLRLERIVLQFRALLDTVGETSRATRSIEGLDRARAQLDLAEQVEFMGHLWSDLAALIRAGAIDQSRGTKRGDSQPGRKKAT
jgi:hypothetical protein